MSVMTSRAGERPLRDAGAEQVVDEPMPKRLTPLGRFYRRTGLRQRVRGWRFALLHRAAVTALWRVRAASLPGALAFADRAADLAYAALPGVRRLALDHLAIALGDTCPPAARERIARQSYRNLARYLVEMAKFEDVRPHFDDHVSVDGWHHLEAVRAMGRGAIVVTGHVGNFDLLAAYAAHRGFPIAAVGGPTDHPRLDQLLVDLRAGYGMQVILRRSQESWREILRVLKRRGHLVLMIDLDIPVPSVSVPYFGRLARTPVAPAMLALRRGVPVVPAFARRRPEGGHHFTILAPIQPVDSGDRRRDVIALTHQFSQLLEDHLRRCPADGIWWHRRWRRSPVPGLDLDAAPAPQPASSRPFAEATEWD
jgi:KDO2-lipid IV(A) lauroyltransferase